MEPQNAIIGDAQGIDLPQAQLDENELIEEKKMAKYSKTAEFKRVQDHFKEKIEFYQRYMPDGRPVALVPKKELEGMWIAANVVIAEFNAVINMYEQATEAVEAANEGLSST